MILSMTGFGKKVLQLPSKKITLELKSLNSKSLDLNVRMPSLYREKELELRNLIAKSLTRGKIDFNLYIDLNGDETVSQLNEGVVKSYMKQLRQIVDADDVELLKMAIRLPDTMRTERDEIDEEEYQVIKQGLNDALTEIHNFREAEGKALEKDMALRIHNIGELLEKVKEIDPERMKHVRERLDKAVAEIKESIDENRFEQELIYYLERFDVTEEKVRLDNHLTYFTETLQSADSNGKKLGFITQEIGREINTLGSKANYAPMQQLVVQMKDELEKIKEQSLNVL
ncbi:YicC/YloC family endoribonuclease [Ascidiimonas aurantiaca]|uniref:YicC/YloC family endoribonuclease n=1 Tax=Ascidiimonas aurantiaca TaxID=1685432 RepID=UPI0030EB967E